MTQSVLCGDRATHVCKSRGAIRENSMPPPSSSLVRPHRPGVRVARGL